MINRHTLCEFIARYVGSARLQYYSNTDAFMKSYKIRRIVELAAGVGLIEPTIVAPRHREKQ